VAKKYPQIIKAIKDQGHHIASHSHTHQLAFNQSRTEFKEDLWKSIDTLQQITGQKITTYRAPGFSITSSNLWAFEVLDEFGIKNDCSIFPASRAHGGLKQFSAASPSIIKYNQVELNSLPINTTKILGKHIVYSGGGYFRLLPYWYLSRRFKNDKYVMTYFHPRDFDPDQPIIPGLSPFRRFKSYVGLSKSYEKLKKLLENHEFINVDIAAKEIDWKNIKKVILN
jgi:polysaccharide deacetylase family protein (PEP-CTERM system associated)